MCDTDFAYKGSTERHDNNWLSSNVAKTILQTHADEKCIKDGKNKRSFFISWQMNLHYPTKVENSI